MAAHFSFRKGSSADGYPSSQMGAIALLRQALLDARWNAALPSPTADPVLVALGVANAIVAALLSPDWKARTENGTEWWGALIFVLCFFTLAAMWARCGLRLRLQSG